MAESKKNGGYLIVVSKIDRKLTLYRNGVALHSYPAGLGFNFLSDKLYSGDRATPEGVITSYSIHYTKLYDALDASDQSLQIRAFLQISAESVASIFGIVPAVCGPVRYEHRGR